MKNLSPFMLFVSGQKRISRNGTLEKQQVSGVCFKARDGVKRVLFLSFILLSRPSSEFGSFNPTLQHLVIRSVFSDGIKVERESERKREMSCFSVLM